MKVMFSLIQTIFQTNCFHKYLPGQIQILFFINFSNHGWLGAVKEWTSIHPCIALTKRILHLEKPHLKNSKRLQNDQVPFLRQVLLLLPPQGKNFFLFCVLFCCEYHSSHHQHCQPPTSICIHKPTSVYYELKNKKEVEQRDSELVTVTDSR